MRLTLGRLGLGQISQSVRALPEGKAIISRRRVFPHQILDQARNLLPFSRNLQQRMESKKRFRETGHFSTSRVSGKLPTTKLSKDHK